MIAFAGGIVMILLVINAIRSIGVSFQSDTTAKYLDPSYLMADCATI